MSDKTHLVSVVLCTLELNDKVQKCLESISIQTYKNFELIVVFKYGKIEKELLDRLFGESIKIRTIKQDQGKLSDARNLGLDSVKGQYVTFIDGDDVVKSNHLEVLIREMKNNVDAVFSTPNLIGNFKPEEYKYFSIHTTGIYTVDLKFILETPVVIWGKLFKRDIIKKAKICFPSNVIFEDNYFHWAYLSQASRVYLTKEKTYSYIKNEGSLMYSLKTCCGNKGLDNLKVLDYIVEFLIVNKRLDIITYQLFRKYYIDATRFIDYKYYKERDRMFIYTLNKLPKGKRFCIVAQLFFRGYFSGFKS